MRTSYLLPFLAAAGAAAILTAPTAAAEPDNGQPTCESVAGGEFIIPTMMLAFGADVRTAGTASLLISLPTVAVGVLRYQRQGAYRDPGLLAAVALPMALGFFAGGRLGPAVARRAPARLLRVLGLDPDAPRGLRKVTRTDA